MANFRLLVDDIYRIISIAVIVLFLDFVFLVLVVCGVGGFCFYFLQWPEFFYIFFIDFITRSTGN